MSNELNELVECIRAAIYDGGNGRRFHDALAALGSLEEQLETAQRELRFVLVGLEPTDHRDAIDARKGCPWGTPDCLWCNIRRVLNPASSPPTLSDENPASVVGVPWNEDGYAGDSNQDTKGEA